MKHLIAALLLTAGVALAQSNLNIKPGSQIKFQDADGSNTVGLRGPNVAPFNITFTLPTTLGSAGQVLYTNAVGEWYWGAAGGGTGLADGVYGDLTLSGGGTVFTVNDGVQIDSLSTADDAFALGWNGSLNVPTKNAIYDKIVTLADLNAPNAWFENVTQTFNPGALTSGLNVGSHAGNPASLVNGDMWYSTATSSLNAYIAGAVVSLGAGGGGGTLTSTYVGYGDGSNALTGEAGFEYNATADTLTVNNAILNGFLALEGATADANETVLTLLDPTADRTISLPDATGVVALTNQLWSIAGDWGSGNGYVTNQIVTASNGSYLCTVTHTSASLTEPGVGANWATVWTQLSEGASPALTTSLVGYGDGSNILTGEAGFSYTAGTNTLDVDVVTVNAEAYGAGWSGDSSVATKDDIYDKVETITSGLGIGAFTGTASYAAGSRYIGTMAADALVTLTGLTSGQTVAFNLVPSGADRTLTFTGTPSYRVGYTNTTTTSLVLKNGYRHRLEFFNNGTDVELTDSVSDDLALGTETTGNYVATIADSGASEVTVSGSGAETAAVTLALAAGITRDAEWDTSAELKTAVTDEVGTGNLMFTRTGVRRTIFVGAGAMIPRTTNGAAATTTETTTNDIMLDSLDFDQTTEEGAGFWMALPRQWDASTVTVRFHWAAASGAGTVKWDITTRGFANDDQLDQVLGTEQTAGADTLESTNAVHLSATTPALTIGGTVAVNTPIYWQVTRDVGGDTLTGDAKLIGVTIEYTENVTEATAQ